MHWKFDTKITDLCYKEIKGKKKSANFSWLLTNQFINGVWDVLHLSSGYNSGLQNFNSKHIHYQHTTQE